MLRWRQQSLGGSAVVSAATDHLVAAGVVVDVVCVVVEVIEQIGAWTMVCQSTAVVAAAAVVVVEWRRASCSTETAATMALVAVCFVEKHCQLVVVVAVAAAAFAADRCVDANR